MCEAPVFIKIIMRRIARKEGGATDTSRDHEYTDWAAVEAFARQCGADLHAMFIATPGPIPIGAGAPTDSPHGEL